MSAPVIRVQNLAKQYHLGHRQAAYATFREALSSAALAPWRRFRRLAGHAAPGGSFWALDDVSFDVRPGEVVGIIGRNGAGKSTLLKILSRITEPTRGRVELTGRVASLLEVGTGFHPELTGRENIYLNGAILGMSRREIQRKFDEIVDFAEIERFLDTPVKHYSSGMYVRLAFSVAAHLEPEILIVDEVLAVGDSAFQKKCLAKLHHVRRTGRTILFVTHNMAVVHKVCTRCILLGAGHILIDSSVQEVLSAYSKCTAPQSAAIGDRIDRDGSGTARLVALTFLNADAQTVDSIGMGEAVTIQATYACQTTILKPHLGVTISTPSGILVAKIRSSEACDDFPDIADTVTIAITVQDLNLVPGTYHVTCNLSEGTNTVIDRVENAASLQVLPRHVPAHGRLASTSAAICFFQTQWTFSTRRNPRSDTSPRGSRAHV